MHCARCVAIPRLWLCVRDRARRTRLTQTTGRCRWSVLQADRRGPWRASVEHHHAAPGLPPSARPSPHFTNCADSHIRNRPCRLACLCWAGLGGHPQPMTPVRQGQKPKVEASTNRDPKHVRLLGVIFCAPARGRSCCLRSAAAESGDQSGVRFRRSRRLDGVGAKNVISDF
jgi:hypothetical protein